MRTVTALRHVAEVRVSNVDKKTVEGERPVNLCNYTDVYYNRQITTDLPLMEATASPQQVRDFSLKAGDSIVTKDSETAEDIAVPAYVPRDLPGVVCGYHLALIRPLRGRIEPRFLTWALRSEYMRDQFSTRASGVTRFGLTYGAIRGAVVPLPEPDEQRHIADFLDDQVARIDQLVHVLTKQIELLEERKRTLITSAVTGEFDVKEASSRAAAAVTGE